MLRQLAIDGNETGAGVTLLGKGFESIRAKYPIGHTRLSALINQKPHQMDFVPYGYVFHLVLFSQIIHHYQPVGILEILLEFVNRLALCHDFRILKQLTEPEFLAFLVNHSDLLLHTALFCS
jgi:hypothetical protein